MNNLIKISILFLFFLTTSCLKEDDGIVSVAPLTGAILEPETEGAHQPNQVWIDLSTGQMTKNKRTDWDLGFYSGNEFRVILNTSVMMAAGAIENVSNIDAVNSGMVSNLMSLVQVANFDPDNIQYVDDVAGNYLENGTAIKEISIDENENKIYLINMGYEIGTGNVPMGSVGIAGASRGWMKIQITRNENDGYLIKYANLDDTTHLSYIIEKNSDYNFTFFSLRDGHEKLIQPKKKEWDICFTVFTNQVFDNSGTNQGTYIFPDFVINNTLSEVGVYQVISESSVLIETYENFSATDVDETRFIYDDHRTIGSNWRSTPNGPVVFGDRFYVLKDPSGYLFKIRFIRMTSLEGERGFPQFEYDPL